MWIFASRKYRLERRAARAFGLKDYAGAIRALDDLLNVVGENPNTLHVLATCRQRLGEHESAIAAAERGLAANPEHLSCLKVLVEIHAGRDEIESARVYAERALALLDHEARSPGILASVMRRFAGPDHHAFGKGLEDREWARWARALCEPEANADKKHSSD